MHLEDANLMGSASQPSRYLEEIWRKRVHAAWLRYQEATENLRRVQLEHAHDIPSPDAHYAIIKAQRNEIWALKAYCRAIKILQELQFLGKVPPPEA